MDPKPRYYRICLQLTVAECAVAFTIALTQWVNLMPLWIAMPDAQQISRFTGYMTTGYGFWGAMWALPVIVMLRCPHAPTLRRFARLSALAYALWWVFWWGQMWNHTWHTWVLVGYLPLRAFQLAAHAAYGWRREP
ncbi:MAG: hypothetical protein MUF16_01830 [Burkholderiaceae bacterium]|jgi:hypothetical protein|nr:hypothetical protein [Burkholderiaceae bacterium]